MTFILFFILFSVYYYVSYNLNGKNNLTKYYQNKDNFIVNIKSLINYLVCTI